MALVELGRYDRNLANILVSRLEADGIPALAFDGGASIADGSWLLIPVRVMVDEDDLAAKLADDLAAGDFVVCLGAGDITYWAAGLANGIAKASSA